MSKIVLNTVTNRIGIHVSGARGASAADIARRTGAVPSDTTDEEYAELTLSNARVKEQEQTGVDLVDAPDGGADERLVFWRPRRLFFLRGLLRLLHWGGVHFF